MHDAIIVRASLFVQTGARTDPASALALTTPAYIPL